MQGTYYLHLKAMKMIFVYWYWMTRAESFSVVGLFDILQSTTSLLSDIQGAQRFWWTKNWPTVPMMIFATS